MRDGWVLSSRGMGGWVDGRGVGLLPRSIHKNFSCKNFTSKMTEEGETSVSFFLVSYFLRSKVMGKEKNGLISTTCVCARCCACSASLLPPSYPCRGPAPRMCMTFIGYRTTMDHTRSDHAPPGQQHRAIKTEDERGGAGKRAGRDRDQSCTRGPMWRCGASCGAWSEQAP